MKSKGELRTFHLIVALTIYIMFGGVASAQTASSDEASAQASTVTVRIWDACDPATFNAQFGAGTCVAGQHGTTVLGVFIDELQKDHIAGAWRFNPVLTASDDIFRRATLNMASGQQLVLRNRGGETHTFTRVAHFGGGVIPVLNQLSQSPNVAPECLKPASATNIFVSAGAVRNGPVANSLAIPLGDSKWECCIHPWMRMVIHAH